MLCSLRNSFSTLSKLRRATCPGLRSLAQLAHDVVPRKRTNVFRSLLSLPDSSQAQSIDQLASRARADVVILEFTDKNLSKTLEESDNIPIYIKTHNPEDISDILKKYHDKIDGLVAVVQCKHSNDHFLRSLDDLEKKLGLSDHHFSVIPVFDTRYSYKDWAHIASSSERNVAAILEDNAPENNDIFSKPPSRIEVQAEAVLASRAAGISVIIGPDMNVSHYPFFRKQNERAKKNGFDGRVALNFDQSIINHDVFKVGKTDEERINAVFANFKGGITTYQRSDQDSRRLLGPPHLDAAEITLKKLKNEQMIDGLRDPPVGVKVRMHPDIKPGIKLGVHVESPLRSHLDVVRCTWQRSFPEITPVIESDEVARSLGFPERQVPFSLLTTLTMGLCVMRFTATEGRWHLGLYNAVQYRYVSAEEEVHCSYIVNEIRTSSQGYPILTSRHYLTNEAGDTVFSVDKVTMWQKDKIQAEDGKIEDYQRVTEDIPLLRHLMGRDYTDQKSRNQLQLHPGQIIRHYGVKQYSPSEAKELANTIRAVNLHHFNHRRFMAEDMVVFGMAAFTGALSLSSRDLGHVIYETWPCAINVNTVNQTDTVRAVTFIRKVKDVPENSDLEEVELKTLSIKNIDDETFASVEIPKVLLVDDALKPSDIEKIVSEECPELSFLITGFVVRNIIRVKTAQ